MTRAGKTVFDQTKKLRGGGTGGLAKEELAKKVCGGNNLNNAGGKSKTAAATGGNSSFITGATASDFFSVFFPAAMALQSGHGCSPSKVLETAVVRVSLRKLLASIVVHATVCSAAQCAPVVNTSVSTTRHFPKRASTATN